MFGTNQHQVNRLALENPETKLSTILDECPELVQTHYAVMRLRRRSLAQAARLKAKQEGIGKKIKAKRAKLGKVKSEVHKNLAEGRKPTQDDIDEYVEAHHEGALLGRQLTRKYRGARCTNADISDFKDAARIYDIRSADLELQINGEKHPNKDPLKRLDPSVLAAIEMLRIAESDKRKRDTVIEGPVLEI